MPVYIYYDTVAQFSEISYYVTFLTQLYAIDVYEYYGVYIMYSMSFYTGKVKTNIKT